MGSVSAELRQAVLQAAMQGKLTEQLPEDGNARDLLVQIRAEKERLIKEGKIKKEKELAPITEDEIPFDIPNNWKWVRLGDVCTKIVDGDHNPPVGVSYPTNYYMLSAININNNTYSLEPVRYLSEDVFKKEQLRTNVHKGDIFFTIVGTLGRSCVYEDNINISFQRSVAVIKTSIYNYYLKYVLDNEYIQRFMVKKSTGTAQKGFYLNQVKFLLIPIPPLAEQKRIVSRVEELMAKIDELEVIENNLRELHQAFPNDMKASLLQAAMQGKLTEQLPEDGNARDLLEQIKSEKERLIKEKKIKKEKELAPITEEEIPFDIPNNWVWVRHNYLFDIVGGSQPPKSEFSDVCKDGYVRLYQIRDYGSNPMPIYVDKLKVKKFSRRGDIILARYGASGKVFWAEEGAYNVALAKSVPRFFENTVYKPFIYYYYNSSLYKNVVCKITKVAVAGFNKEEISDMLFPLPPFAEQKRIVEKLNKLLPLCESLKM